METFGLDAFENFVFLQLECEQVEVSQKDVTSLPPSILVRSYIN
jgi:hypothetical protein